jgi:flagellar FliL protein
MTDRAFDQDVEVAESAAAAPAAPRWRKPAILVGAGVLALLLIGGGLWVSGLGQKLIGHADEKQEPAAEAAPKKTVYYDFPDLLVNLNGNGRKTSFLKISISLELEDAADVPKLQGVMPRIVDNFQVYLRELRPEDLKGSAGIYRLREELLTRVAAAAAPVKVVDVLFKEMLVQ